jgi:hypothetical protein
MEFAQRWLLMLAICNCHCNICYLLLLLLRVNIRTLSILMGIGLSLVTLWMYMDARYFSALGTNIFHQNRPAHVPSVNCKHQYAKMCLQERNVHMLLDNKR